MGKSVAQAAVNNLIMNVGSNNSNSSINDYNSQEGRYKHRTC